MRELWLRFIRQEIEQALLCQQSSFLARVLRCETTFADIQPLFIRKKQNGETEVPQPIFGVPLLQGLALQNGDVVLCQVCDRELGAAVYGEMCLPRPGAHPPTGSIIVGVVQK